MEPIQVRRKTFGGTELPSHVQMMQLGQGHMRTQAIIAAAKLGGPIEGAPI